MSVIIMTVFQEGYITQRYQEMEVLQPVLLLVCGLRRCQAQSSILTFHIQQLAQSNQIKEEQQCQFIT